MNGWDHVFFTTIIFIIGWILLGWIASILGWILPAGLSFWFFLVAWVGGIFPDFDIQWKPLLGHRSIITHSVLAPLMIVALFITPVYLLGWWTLIDRYFIAIFLLGCACHLFLDLAPSTRSVLNRWLKNPLEAFVYIEKGLKAPPGNITYVPKQYEKGWLIGNGVALVAFVIMALLFIFPALGL
ncbi:MAG: hypothetical protein ACFFDU_00490 [Candidatus Thorarchaeota archaeon]